MAKLLDDSISTREKLWQHRFVLTNVKTNPMTIKWHGAVGKTKGFLLSLSIENG